MNSNKFKSFNRKIACIHIFITAVGYYLGNLPQIFIDPLVNVSGFGYRSYEYWWLIIPIGLFLFFSLLFVCFKLKKRGKEQYLWNIPLLIAMFLSIWIYWPNCGGLSEKCEIIHGNILSVSIVWTLNSFFFLKLKFENFDFESKLKNSYSNNTVKSEYNQVNIIFWISLFATIILLFVIFMMAQYHNKEIAQEPGEVNILNQNTRIFFFISAFTILLTSINAMLERKKICINIFNSNESNKDEDLKAINLRIGDNIQFSNNDNIAFGKDQAVVSQSNVSYLNNDLLNQINNLKSELSKLSMDKKYKEALNFQVNTLEKQALSDQKNSIIMKTSLETLKNIAQGAISSASGSCLFEIIKRIYKII